ncbi:uncharacterized protein LOC108089099 [Drosophila ficusphila]|uniref:uncharacterized protein LOC108089099 n=1 Tax=Drosophila ficusphila TaxID=30025 RepID=UPI0007E6BE6D|nr:uncharacterized protein LOC108089099 [Drosophila ficusphila]
MDLRLQFQAYSEQDTRTSSEHLPPHRLPLRLPWNYSAVLAGLSAESSPASLPIHRFTDLEQEREGLRWRPRRRRSRPRTFYRREESAVIRGQSIRYKRTKHSQDIAAVSYLIAASSDNVGITFRALFFGLAPNLEALGEVLPSCLPVQSASRGEGEDNTERAPPAEHFRDFQDRNTNTGTGTDTDTETPV